MEEKDLDFPANVFGSDVQAAEGRLESGILHMRKAIVIIALGLIQLVVSGWASDRTTKLKKTVTSCGQSTSPAQRNSNPVLDGYGVKGAWLIEDVRYIITDPERAAFKTLKNDEERENFVDQFWRRRDPTPDTIGNEFEDEHYRRMVYANEHFSSNLPGWRTDRGRIYVMYGPPDSIESMKFEAVNGNAKDRGLANAPVEVWRYRYIQGIGQEIKLAFADECNCGDFHMTALQEDVRSPKDNRCGDLFAPSPSCPPSDLRELCAIP